MTDEKIIEINGDKNKSEEERAALRQRGYHEIKSIEEFMEIATKVGKTHEFFTKKVKHYMTRSRAKRIKDYRLKHNLSWREIAYQTYRDWGGIKRWHPLSNQIVGIALCEVAADVLGEKHWE